ncbi:hypothetical protein P0Y67_07030 [Photobacterium sp. SP02]|uniref:hypothetical protein n=1 Tax=Photobacterium sp. SP02 TaxID=3032280 RepID=UPI003144DC1C
MNHLKLFFREVRCVFFVAVMLHLFAWSSKITFPKLIYVPDEKWCNPAPLECDESSFAAKKSILKREMA